MIRSKLFVSCAFAVLLVLVAAPAWADSIPVANASFAISNPLNIPFSSGPYNLGPIPDWTTTGTSGSLQPNSLLYSSIPGGSIVAYTDDGGSISQDLGIGLLANTSYTLSVFVGNRLDGFSGNYTIALDAGSTTLCTFSGNSASITPGTFAQESCTFQSGSVLPAGDLSVIFSSPQGTQLTQLDISDVSVSTPEPGSLALLTAGVGFLFFFARRKQQLPLSA